MRFMNKKDIAIVGAGGHTRSTINLINREEFNIIGIYDESFSSEVNEEILGIGVKGTQHGIPANVKIVLSVGDNKKRKTLYREFLSRIIQSNLIHQSSIIEDSCSLGIANLIFANVYLNSKSVIGDNNILNTACIIEHEASLGSHNHISVGSVICGRVSIGNECFIGAGSVIKNGVEICSEVILGANSLVIRNITEPGVYVGSPAKKIS